MGGQQSGDGFRAEAQPHPSQFLVHALRHPAFQPRERRLAGLPPRQPAQPARLPARRPLFRRLCRLVPAANGGGDLVLPDRPDARYALVDLRSLLPEPRPVADFRPADLAHGAGRRPRVREENCCAARRHPPRLPGALGPSRSGRPAGDACRWQRDVRSGGHGLPQRPVAGHPRQCRQRRSAWCAGVRALPAQPRAAAHRPCLAAAR